MNPGAHPIDPTTPVGQLRYLLGDTEPTADATAPEGAKSYAIWSDAALLASLAIADGNVLRAAGQLISQLAVFYAQQGQLSVKADDLGLSISARGSDLTAIARSFFSEALERAKATADDFFVIATRSPGFCL